MTDVKAADYAFEVYTDGSGYSDNFGGAGCFVKSSQYRKIFIRCNGVYGTTVYRSEFDGLLMALQGILEEMDWLDGRSQRQMNQHPVKVLWIGDNQALVRCVARYIDPTTQQPFARKSAPDLWARFHYYETLFNVTAIHVPRDTVTLQKIADRLASESRVVLKDVLLSRQILGVPVYEVREAYANYTKIVQSDLGMISSTNE